MAGATATSCVAAAAEAGAWRSSGASKGATATAAGLALVTVCQAARESERSACPARGAWGPGWSGGRAPRWWRVARQALRATARRRGS